MSESPEEEEKDLDSPGPLRSDSKAQTLLQEPQYLGLDDSFGSPRKRTQTLPAFNCPLTGMAAKAEALRWSRNQESVEEKSETFSEDIFKILDLRTSGSFFGGSQSSNKDKEDRLTARRGSDHTCSSTIGSHKAESDTQPLQVLPHQRSTDTLVVRGPVQQVNNKPEPQQYQQQVLNTWVQLSSHDVHSVILCCKTQIKNVYYLNKSDQMCPFVSCSLQQQNKELKATVAELQAALEAERRHVAALEICLKNAERGQAETQKRNEELQRDIERFLVKGQ